MDTKDVGTTSHQIINVSSKFSELRETVLQHWAYQVRNEIPEADQLAEKFLTNALPRFFDEIIVALDSRRPYTFTASGISAISSHGRQRATSTGYEPKDLLLEIQIYRKTLYEVADANNVTLNQNDRAIIGRSIDNAAQEAMNAFAVAHREIGETFIACLSHDLRNPLNVANVAAQLIEMKSDDERILALASRIRDKLKNIDEMIQTLLDAAALNGRKKLRLKIISFDMKSLADEIGADMSTSSQPIISVGTPVAGFWCLASMRRVFENILTNAKKYGDPNALIEVRTAILGNQVVLSFHNEGPAIPQKELQRLFRTFHRIDDIDIKGWGLGLPYVQLVVESHGGGVAVQSAPSHGTTFILTLPIDCRIHDAESDNNSIREP